MTTSLAKAPDETVQTATLLLRQGRDREAIAFLKTRRQLSLRAMDCLCEAYSQIRDWKSAQAVNDVIMKSGFGRPRHFKLEAVLLSNAGQYTQALEKIKHYLDVHGPDHEALGVARQCCHFLGRHDEAVRYGQTALILKAREADGDVRRLHPNAAGRDVISFSLWGNDRIYLLGVAINIRLAAEFFPDWTVIVYAASSIDPGMQRLYQALGAEVVLADVVHPEVPPYFWRFLVADAPDVRHFLCRDADGRLSQEENMLVGQWLASGKPFHVVRDHVQHDDLMLAGLWGGTAAPDFDMAGLITRYFNGHVSNRYGSDQAFLGRCVWPLVKPAAYIHDRHYQTPGMPSHEHGLDIKFGWGCQDEQQVIREAAALGLLLN